MRRLFEFLPVMAEALDKPVEGWWAELLNHLPPQAVTVADDVGGNIYCECEISVGFFPNHAH